MTQLSATCLTLPPPSFDRGSLLQEGPKVSPPHKSGPTWQNGSWNWRQRPRRITTGALSVASPGAGTACGTTSKRIRWFASAPSFGQGRSISSNGASSRKRSVDADPNDQFDRWTADTRGGREPSDRRQEPITHRCRKGKHKESDCSRVKKRIAIHGELAIRRGNADALRRYRCVGTSRPCTTSNRR